MELKTSKLQRKTSLSLCRDNKNKRHSGSPQTRLRAAQSVAVATAAAASASYTTKVAEEAMSMTPPPRSPSVSSLDGGIEFTPPNNRKRTSILNNNNLDDSIDYSPKAFDMSFSPGCMLSQTLATESPEVGWRWARRTADETAAPTTKHLEPIATPDSAYGADSSFTSASASSSSEAGVAAGRARGESLRQRTAYERRRDEHCTALELKRQRAEKMRADEALKRRCAKLQQQLQEAADASILAANKQKIDQEEKQKTSMKPNATAPVQRNTRFSLAKTSASPSAVTAMVVDLDTALPSGNSAAKESLDDFFNDSESDSFLLAATQQLESQISTKVSQKSEPPRTQKLRTTVSHSSPVAAASAVAVVAAATTPTSSSCKEKRSSLYLQFLEDDADDWFVSLDEVAIRKASEAKKPRSTFQRYKSLPADTSMTSAAADSVGKSGTNSTTAAADGKTTKTTTTSAFGSDAASVRGGVAKMKRHVSSHALSPSSSSYRGRQLHLRK